MTREEKLDWLYRLRSEICVYMPKEWVEPMNNALDMAIKALEQETCEDYMSRADALRVAENEYSRGWHNALCKALSEKYSIHCEEGNFSVIQEETITGLGLSMDCAVGKDVESYMSTIPRVTPQEPILDKIRAEIMKLDDINPDYPMDRTIHISRNEVLQIIDKYKVESEDEGDDKRR